MQRLLSAFIFAFVLLGIAPFCIHTLLSLAVTTNCVITKVGNAPANPPLPAPCNQSAGGGNQDIIALAKANLNKTYVWGAPARDWASEDPNAGKTPANFDCSGFAGWVEYWGTKGKVKMSGQTQADWDDTSGKYMKHPNSDKTGLVPGDLVYFGTQTQVHHVGIWEGAGSLGQCTTNDCFLEEYDTGNPGRENSLAKEKDYAGYLHPVIQ